MGYLVMKQVTKMSISQSINFADHCLILLFTEDDHPPAKPLAVDSKPEVQLTDQSDSETDVGAVDDEDTSTVSGPKDLGELL